MSWEDGHGICELTLTRDEHVISVIRQEFCAFPQRQSDRYRAVKIFLRFDQKIIRQVAPDHIERLVVFDNVLAVLLAHRLVVQNRALQLLLAARGQVLKVGGDVLFPVARLEDFRFVVF